MILDKYVEVTMVGKNCKYYGDKGYPNKYKSKAMVKVEDLSPGSHAEIRVKCDFCGKERVIKYRDYYKTTQGNTRALSCEKCKAKTITRQTMLEQYGYEYGLQVPEIREKGRKTLMEKYGASSPQQIEEIKEKTKQTNIKRYGGPGTMCSAEVRAKQAKTLAEKGSVRTSVQQKYLAKLFNGILNKPCKQFLLDIYLPEYNLDIEYDGGGHDLPVRIGTMTQEQFNRREIIRGRIIRAEGFKQMTITSTNDDLPSEEVLNDMLNYAIYYLTTTNHTWIEYNIQEGTFKNALGVYPYDFGELISKYRLYQLLGIINNEKAIKEVS